MSIFELIVLSIGLSMDAFAVAICKGLSAKQIKPRHAVITGLYFGGFQALMPITGYFLGFYFQKLIENFDHWVAFVLLSLIGANMIRESLSKDDEEIASDSFALRFMLPMAVATSIDALAVGITLAFLKVNIWSSASIIGITTFCFSAAGIALGKTLGAKFKSKAEFIGGLILILIGLKIILEHTAII